MEIAIVIILLLVGVVLFLIEMFLLPGVSIAGIGGVIFLGGAVYYAYAFIGQDAGHLTLLATVFLMGISIWIFLRSRVLEKMSLKTEIDSKNDPLAGIDIQVGDVGVTISRLAPMGKIKINGQLVEAKSTDDFIDEGTSVKITKVYTTNVLVERLE